jgi:divinyl protochlorophyllide a 8-vinyl-reductase
MAVIDSLTGAEAPRSAALIGPNAILQTEAALNAAGGQALVERVFAKAGLLHLLAHRPDAMIAEEVPRALFKALFECVPRRDGIRIALDAGRRTGRYILRYRMPAPARWILRRLPAAMACPLLLKAIKQHAWTFAGSGDCEVKIGPPAQVMIADNPMKMPLCAWHTGVLEVLFQSLVSSGARVIHTTSRPGARSVCTFTCDWRI